MSSQIVRPLDSVSAFLKRQHGLYIDGGWVAARGQGTLPVFNPATGEQIATTADADEADVDQAVQSAHQAFISGVWSRRLPATSEALLDGVDAARRLELLACARLQAAERDR